MTNQTDIGLWLTKRIGAELNITENKIDPQTPFVDYGIDSASAIGVMADLEDFLGQPLDPNLFYEYPTIYELANHLKSGAKSEEMTEAQGAK